MKFDQSLEVTREESFDIGIADVSIISVSSEIRIIESIDGKCHVKIMAGSKKAAELIHAVEIVASDLNVDIDGNSISGELNSEISLDAAGESPLETSKVVKIISTTISGNFNLVSN